MEGDEELAFTILLLYVFGLLSGGYLPNLWEVWPVAMDGVIAAALAAAISCLVSVRRYPLGAAAALSGVAFGVGYASSLPMPPTPGDLTMAVARGFVPLCVICAAALASSAIAEGLPTKGTVALGIASMSFSAVLLYVLTQRLFMPFLFEAISLMNCEVPAWTLAGSAIGVLLTVLPGSRSTHARKRREALRTAAEVLSVQERARRAEERLRRLREGA